jgi:hypothetical protein
MDENFRVLLSAALDTKSGQDIQKQVDNIKLKSIEVPFQIDMKDSKKIESEMQRMVKKLTDRSIATSCNV